MEIPVKILFICTHNRCRSILSEAITNHLSSQRLLANSAGSSPAGEVHPLSLQYLAEINIPTNGLQSQSWDEFESFDPDIVVTVCDDAANETCPVWFGNNIKIHWPLRDPSKVQGSQESIAMAFRDTIREITDRTRMLMELPLEEMDQQQLEDRITLLVKQAS